MFSTMSLDAVQSKIESNMNVQQDDILHVHVDEVQVQPASLLSGQSTVP